MYTCMHEVDSTGSLPLVCYPCDLFWTYMGNNREFVCKNVGAKDERDKQWLRVLERQRIAREAKK